MAATDNRIRRTERETRDRKWLDSGFFFVFAGGKWGDDGRSAWAKRWKKRWDLLTHDHGVRRKKRRVVEIVVVSRPTTRAVNLMSVPLRDRDGTWWCGRRAGKSLGDSLGYSGGGRVWARTSSGWRLLLRCDVRRLSSRRLFPVGMEKASSVPGTLLAMPQWPCNGNWRTAAQDCRGVGLGMTGDLVTISTGDLLLLFLLLPAVDVPQW